MESEVIEEQADLCPICGDLVISYWIPNQGCLRDPNYVLVAAWIVHTACFDRMVEEHPPDGIRN